VSGELTSVSFRLSDACLIGLIELVKSIKLPAAPEVTFEEIQQFRVSLFVCYSITHDTCSRNWRYKLTPFSDAGFWRRFFVP